MLSELEQCLRTVSDRIPRHHPFGDDPVNAASDGGMVYPTPPGRFDASGGLSGTVVFMYVSDSYKRQAVGRHYWMALRTKKGLFALLAVMLLTLFVVDVVLKGVSLGPVWLPTASGAGVFVFWAYVMTASYVKFNGTGMFSDHRYRREPRISLTDVKAVTAIEVDGDRVLEFETCEQQTALLRYDGYAHNTFKTTQRMLPTDVRIDPAAEEILPAAVEATTGIPTGRYRKLSVLTGDSDGSETYS